MQYDAMWLLVVCLFGVVPSPHASTKLRRVLEGQINYVREVCESVSNRLFDSDVPHQRRNFIGFFVG